VFTVQEISDSILYENKFILPRIIEITFMVSGITAGSLRKVFTVDGFQKLLGDQDCFHRQARNPSDPDITYISSFLVPQPMTFIVWL
jgi:hypothetical protein